MIIAWKEIIMTITFPHSAKFSFRNKHLVDQIELDLSGITDVRNTLPKLFAGTEINTTP